MDIRVSNNKRYECYKVSEDVSFFEGYYGNYAVDIDLRKKLAKDLGFSYDLYLTLSNQSIAIAKTLVQSVSEQSKHTEVFLLVDEDQSAVVGYSLDGDRSPVLNSEFIKRVYSLAESSEAISVVESHYLPEDSISSVLLKKNTPIFVEEKYESKESKITEYEIGVLILNDESSASSTRLVLYVEGQPLYLPASYYNATTSRYKKSTSSTAEALEVLVLKVIDDLREDSLKSKVEELHYRYRVNKYVLASYEEYNSVLRTMRKIPTIIEDNSFLESLLAKYEDFERKYSKLEDQKSSYIWRCTALSDIPVGALVSITSDILSDLNAPSMEYFSIRELLGTYISTNRIAEEIAKEN